MEGLIPDAGEVGGKVVRQDLEEVIERELNYRLGEGDAPSALPRWQKEILLTGFNAVRAHSLLSQLHAKAAIKAGATLDQVLQIAISLFMMAPPRWKLAGQWAFKAAAEEVAKAQGLKSPKAPTGEKQKKEEVKQSVLQLLQKMDMVEHQESTAMWEEMAVLAPAVLEGFMKMREVIMKPDPKGALPKKIMELATVGVDILAGNTWGAQLHTRAAVRAGATVPEVVETVALFMIEGGGTVYQQGGLLAIEAAEKEVAKLAG